MPIFVSYRLLNSLKTCASIAPPKKESSYPYFRHGNAVYTNNFENFVQNIWLCKKFFVPFIPQGNSGTRIFIKMLQINLHIPKILRTFASAYKERNMCVPFDCFFHNVYTTAWPLVRAAMPFLFPTDSSIF